MKRKVLSILLSMLMIFSTQVTALASEETLISSIDAIILQKAERLLQIAATDPTAFGVSGVNYGTLSLGNGIPTYEYINGDYIQTDVYYYPVYSNNSIFAVILAEVKSEDDISVGFTTETAPELNAFLNAHSSSAILLDRNGAYAFSGGDLLEIAENQFPVTERSVIGNVQPHTANSDIAISQIAEVSRGQIAPLLARDRSQISLYSELPPGNPSHRHRNL